MAQVDQKRAKRARASGNAEEKALLQDLMAGKGVNKEILVITMQCNLYISSQLRQLP